jgi:Mg-chelatase subunit ChlD
MTYEFFGHTYTLLQPAWLWPLVFLPLLWLPLYWLRHRRVLLSAALLRSLAAVLIFVALAGLSRQRIIAEHKLALVAAIDVSDSIAPEGRAWTQEYLARVMKALEPGDEFAALSFAAEAHVLVPLGGATDVMLPPETLPRAPAGEGDGTNIARALERAFSLYPQEAEKRLLLLTDGNETTGAARRLIALARQMGVKIFPVIPPSAPHPEVSLGKLIVPSLVHEGSTFSLRLVVHNGNETPVRGRASILADDQPLTRQAVTLEPGLSVLEVPVQILRHGNYLLRAEVEAVPDTIADNNHQSASLAVAGKIRALVIMDNPKTQLAPALQMKEIEVEVRQPGGIPTQITELLAYNCLVFDDIGSNGITPQQMAAVESYVRDFGGGFLMTGGQGTFGDLGYKGTAIERTLPVTFQEQPPQKKKRTPIALFVVIDRSNSMGYNSKVRGLHDGQKMQYAKQAAIEVLNQLQDTDYAGVIAFDSEPYLLSSLARLSENRFELLNKIAQLQYGGGTDFYGALETAAEQLGQTRGAIRHIMLLTDGDSNRNAADHYPLVAAIAQRQITITTIRIGSDTVNLELLSYISEQTGGRFYHVADAEALPQLLVKDTKQAIRESGEEEDEPKEVKPHVGIRGQILQGLENFPALEEFMVTQAKTGADVQLYTDVHAEHEPLLVTWQYGLGRGVAVPFDPSGSGSSEWIKWAGFGKFWSQAVRWAIREQTPWDYRLSAQQRGGRTILQVESSESDAESIWQARLPQGTPSDELTFVPIAPRVYEATLPLKRQGSFPVTITKRKDGKVVTQRTEMVMVSAAPHESLEEYRRQDANRDLLRELAEGTGGRIDPDPSELIAQKREGHKILIHPLDSYLIVIGLLLLLGDIAIRVLFGPPV